jgi:acyl carrier protein
MEINEFNAILKSIWQSRHPDEDFTEVDILSSFDSLGFDSLDIMELVLAIEEDTGKTVDQDIFFEGLAIRECLCRLQ